MRFSNNRDLFFAQYRIVLILVFALKLTQCEQPESQTCCLHSTTSYVFFLYFNCSLLLNCLLLLENSFGTQVCNNESTNAPCYTTLINFLSSLKQLCDVSGRGPHDIILMIGVRDSTATKTWSGIF